MLSDEIKGPGNLFQRMVLRAYGLKHVSRGSRQVMTLLDIIQ